MGEKIEKKTILEIAIPLVAIIISIAGIWVILHPDFQLTINPIDGAVKQGGVVHATLTLDRLWWYQNDVLLSQNGQLPPGIVVSFDNPKLKDKQNTSPVTLTVSKDVTADVYRITLVGLGSDGKEHSLIYTLTVNPSPTPVVTVSPTPVVTVSPTPVVTVSPTPVVTVSPTPVVTVSPTPVPTPPPTTVIINNPKNGDGVDEFMIVSGTSVNVPSGQNIWVFVHQGDRFYPMANPAIMLASGEWSSGTYFGGDPDTGKTYEIYMILPNSTAEAQINMYNTNSRINGVYPGMQTIPPGSIIYGPITVIRNPPPPKPSVNIAYPMNGSTASQLITVQGTSKDLPAGKAIWAIVYVHSNSFYYPMPAAVVVKPDGSWQTQVTLGGPTDNGQQFDIIMTVADQYGQATLVAYNQDAEKNHPNNYPGIPQIPAGVVPYSIITVIRGPWIT
jgi:hypothetical protein